MNVLESNLSALLLKATLILLAVVVARFALRRASAATRHLCLTMAMFGVVLLPVLSLSLPVWQLEVLPHGSSALTGGASGSPIPFEEELEASGSATLPGLSSPESRAEVPATGGRFQPGLTEWLIVIWAVGAALVLVKLSAGLLRMRWIARNGVRVTDPDALRQLDECVNTLQLQVRPLLIASEHAGVPLVWGWLRPALIIPLGFRRWTPNRVRAVLLHELGHLKRNDWPVLLLGRIVAAFYWFHPLAWFVERCAKHECERACDDIVVTCGTKPSDYASHLLSIARGVSETPASVRAALAVVRRSQLNSRLRSILDPLLRRDNPSRTVVTGLGTVLMLVLLPLASLQLAEQAYANEPQEKAEVLLAQHQHEKKLKEKQLEHVSEASEGELAYKRGYKLHSRGDYEAAIDAFEEARELGFKPAAATYNIACGHALMGDARQAMSWLDRAFDAGFEGPETLVQDSDFDPIRKSSAFQAYIDRAFEAAGVERRAPDHYPYQTMLDAIEKLEASGSTNPKKWHHVGTKLLGMQEYDLAIDALTAAVENSGEKSGTSLYNLACAYALAGQERQALESLDRSVDAGFDQQERFVNDSDLESLRSSAEFARIKNKSEFLSMDRIKKHVKGGSGRSPEDLAPLIDEYQGYVAKHPSSGRAWFNLGYAQHSTGQYDDAIGAWEKAASLGYHTSTANYNVGCAHSMLNNIDAALDALEIAVESGRFHYEGLESDDDLDNLRDEPRFQSLLDRLEKQREHEHQKKMQMKMQYKAQQKAKQLKHDHDD